jgi:tRNA dimethylallyltransferase
MQIYRHMDIGTAKPSEKERAAVKHHMLDIADPREAFSAGRYIAEVVPVIEGLLRQGKIPIIAGGTGLYIKAMTRGLFRGPSSDPALRESLLAREAGEKGTLHAYLRTLDPEAAGRIEKNDIRRIIRAIEVCVKSGDTMSVSQQKHTHPLPYTFFRIGLARERKELYAMIDARVDAMLRRGLQEEVTRLLAMSPDRTPLQAIGYKEIARYLRQETDLQEAVRLIKRNSRRYAKRQLTWFGQEKDIRWIDVTGLYESGDIVKKIMPVVEEVLGPRPQSA